MLSESDLRKPGFAGGVPIELADGQEWHFPRPTLRLVPQVGPDGRAKAVGRFDVGEGYDDLLDEFYTADSGLATVEAMMTLAVALLGFNYGLQPADYATLLHFDGDDEATGETWRRIMEVAQGNAPKALAHGESPT